MNVGELLKQSLFIESLVFVVAIQFFFRNSELLRNEAFPLFYNGIMEFKIKRNHILNELSKFSSMQSDSLSDLITNRDAKNALVLQYNIVRSKSNIKTLIAYLVVIVAILAFNPKLLVSLMVSDIIISRLRQHFRYSFS